MPDAKVMRSELLREKSPKDKKPVSLSKIAMYSVIVIVAFIYLYPLLFVINISLKTQREFYISTVSLTKTLYVKNYLDAWVRGNFGSYIFNSIFYTFVCTAASILFAFFAAFPIARKYVRGSNLLFSFFLTGLFLPSGLIPLFQLILKLHLYNNPFGYMLTLINGGGLPLFVLVTYIATIPREYDEAAVIDGCGYFRYVVSIAMPLAKPALISVSILTAINVWNDIIGATIFLSNTKYFPISLGLFAFSGQYQNSWPQMTAAIAIVSLPLVILYLALQKNIDKGVTAGGIKM